MIIYHYIALLIFEQIYIYNNYLHYTFGFGVPVFGKRSENEWNDGFSSRWVILERVMIPLVCQPAIERL